MGCVEIRGISKLFGKVRAVDHVDLVTNEGEFLVLLGPSGCGKTTLLRMIAGIEIPSEGEFIIDGRVVTDLPPRMRNIAMVFQSYALYPHMTVYKNIAFPLSARGVEKEAVRKKVEWAAGMFKIGRLLDRKPRELSGGERQRVALARAMVREPSVFLLDEPLSNLDALLRTSAREELRQFQRRVGVTTIYVTHDQVEAMGLGDRIVVMSQGRIRQVGTPLEIYQYPSDTFVATFVGSPPMNLLEQEDVLLGFRPETFLPADAVEGSEGVVTWPFEVTYTEYLGAERLVYGNVGEKSHGRHVVSRLPGALTLPLEAGKTYPFAVARRDSAPIRQEERAGPHRRRGVTPPARPGSSPAPYRGGILDRKETLAKLLIAPAVLYIVAMIGAPFVLAILYSLSDATTGSPSLHLVGLRNFGAALADPVFRLALRNTFVFTLLSQVIVILLSRILANALLKPFRGKWLVRFLILLPWTAPISLGTIGWLWMYRLDLQPHRLGAPVPRVARDRHRAPRLRDEPLLAGGAGARDRVGHHRQRLADPSAGHGDPAGGLELHPERPHRGRRGRRRVPVAPDADDHDPPHAADRQHRLPLRDRLHLHGPGRRLRPDAGRAGAHDAGALLLDVLQGDRGRRPGPGGGHLPLHVPGAGRGRDPNPADGPADGGGLMANPGKLARRGGLYTLLGVFAFFGAFPFYWMVIATFKRDHDLFSPLNNPFLFNEPPTLDHLRLLFTETHFVGYLTNTVIVGLAVVVITLATAVPAAYALARWARGWGETLGIGIFLTYLVPPTILFIPLSRFASFFGLQESLWSLILVYPTFTIPFCTWLLMGFFKTIPKDIEEQAMIDGLSRFGAMTKVVFPLAISGILTVVVFSFTLSMHEFIYALTFISVSAKKTVSIGVPTELVRGDVFQWGPLMAGALIASLPVAVVYTFFLDRFVAGFTMGAVK